MFGIIIQFTDKKIFMPGNRKSGRLKGYDYTKPGAYFITICAKDRDCLFGCIHDGELTLNDAGKAVESTWTDLPRHNKNIKLDEYVIMPNHFHGIIHIVGAGSKPALINGSKPALINGSKPALINGSKPARIAHELSEIVRQFNTFSVQRVNQIKNSPGIPLWQRDFYEHMIGGNEVDLKRIREYIVNNPVSWGLDDYYRVF